MNKLIREFAEQCETKEIGYYFFDREKFAELIIQECAACCGSQADKKNIRKRFGLPVESNVKYEGPDAHGSITSQYTREYNLPK